MTSRADRSADRSPSARRSRDRSVQQARVLVDAARRLVGTKGESFTTQELVKEAGVALQTFYRYFGGKDELLLAAFEDMIAEAAAGYGERVVGVASPVARLERHVAAVVAALGDPAGHASRRFVSGEHWRLAQLYPEAIGDATKPIADLLEREIAAATAQGLLDSQDPARDAWFIGQLLMSVYHHHSFTDLDDPGLGRDLWGFVHRALGGEPGTERRTA